MTDAELLGAAKTTFRPRSTWLQVRSSVRYLVDAQIAGSIKEGHQVFISDEREKIKKIKKGGGDGIGRW